jgi:putative nucleotidyltransferase with HDIG domain
MPRLRERFFRKRNGTVETTIVSVKKKSNAVLARKAQEKKRELLKLLRQKSPQTFSHSLGVTNWSVRIARELKQKFQELDLEKVEDSALLHDIGKLGVNLQKLHMKRKLAPQDIEEIRRKHISAARGFLGKNFPKDVVEAIVSHHERFDGQGYPFGLQGNSIPLISRILRVADEFQTHIEPRPFIKQIVSIPVAWNKILHGKENSFDPVVVDALGSVLKKLGLI